MIKIENVCKKFGNNVLFENASVVIQEKKTLIKGENGEGKSVLLKMIVGYSVPDQGKIFYDDNKLLGKETDFIENAGVSINAPEFVKNWTGMENLTYLSKINKTCPLSRIEELVNILYLDGDIHKKYKTYSLGMKQKMRLIQALMDQPRYLILDEPFNALDVKSKNTAKDYINKYLEEGDDRILIYTSHTKEDDDFANQIILIDNHALVEETTKS